MKGVADDGAELVAAAKHELDAGAAWAAGVEEDVLGTVFAAQSNQRKGEDVVGRVGGVELVHGHRHGRALDGAALDITARFPREGLAVVGVVLGVVMVGARPPEFDIKWPWQVEQGEESKHAGEEDQLGSSGRDDTGRGRGQKGLLFFVHVGLDDVEEVKDAQEDWAPAECLYGRGQLQRQRHDQCKKAARFAVERP